MSRLTEAQIREYVRNNVEGMLVMLGRMQRGEVQMVTALAALSSEATTVSLGESEQEPALQLAWGTRVHVDNAIDTLTRIACRMGVQRGD